MESFYDDVNEKQSMTAVTLLRMRWVLEGKAGVSKPHRELLEAVWENHQ